MNEQIIELEAALNKAKECVEQEMAVTCCKGHKELCIALEEFNIMYKLLEDLKSKELCNENWN
jgi:hypothetical protein